MKNNTYQKISIILLSLLFSIAVSAQQNAPNGGQRNLPNGNAAEPAGQFVNVTVVYNVEKNGRKGMVIQGKFNVQNALNKSCQLVGTFEYNDGRKLKGEEKGYIDTQGNVTAYTVFTPQNVRSTYNDLQVFIPYKAFNMGAGKSILRLKMWLYDVNARKYFAQSGYVNFNYNSPN